MELGIGMRWVPYAVSSKDAETQSSPKSKTLTILLIIDVFIDRSW